MKALDQILQGLEPAAALSCLVAAWRGAAGPILVEEIARRSELYERTTDWDLDRFDVTTLPRVLSWLCDSGPFSADLEVVLDRIEPFLPDPRAAKPLAELATKPTRAQARIQSMAERQVLPATSLDEVGVLRQLSKVIAEEQAHQRRFQELLREESLGARAVLADWLMARGEPLGEFAGLQLGRGEVASPRELALWGQYGVGWIRQFLGAGLLNGGNGASVRSQVRFERGVPFRVTASDLSVGAAKGPGWRHVRELVVHRGYRWGAPEDFEPELGHAVTRLIHLDAPLTTFELIAAQCTEVRSLTLRGATSGWEALGKLVLSLPALRSVKFDRVSTFDANGLAKELRGLRARSIAVCIRINEAELSVPPEAAPFVTAAEDLSIGWAPTLEAVREVTGAQPHFIRRDVGRLS